MQENMDGGSSFQQERSSLERFRLQLAQKERELHLREEQLREEHKQELAALRQENYVLQSKVSHCIAVKLTEYIQNIFKYKKNFCSLGDYSAMALHHRWVILCGQILYKPQGAVCFTTL